MRKHVPVAAIGALLLALAISGCGGSTVTPPSQGGDAPAGASEVPDAPTGTRENPAPLGSTVEDDEWAVVVNSVTLAATDAVLAENPFNDAPPEGQEYILVNLTMTYKGNNPEGETPLWVTVEYVTPQGNTINGSETMSVAPDGIDTFSTLYSGASVTGNKAFAVPSATAAEGVLAISPGLLSDKIFVAVQ
ncbi:MAG: DUF4352 domain-containing protein [Propionibacteriaceae bacterium]|jgi:hypothetical protein|nr:DUF4352 domain-containing protein [Propionibacteriaceae bacterium]